MHSSCQRERHGKVNDKKKVMGKERSKEERFVEKVETYGFFKPRQFPSHTKKFLIVRKIQDTHTGLPAHRNTPLSYTSCLVHNHGSFSIKE
jgi:hypothetical protein